MSARGWAAAGVLAALLAASSFVASTTPTATEWEQPFPVDAPLGAEAVGRNIAGTVHAAHLSDQVENRAWQSGDGSVWLVVDATMESVREDAAIRYAVVQVGGRTFSASDRLGSSTLRSTSIQAGIPTRGTLVFELPASILDDAGATTAELRVGASADPRLDSVLVTPLDLPSLTRESSTTITAPEWGAP